MKRLKGLTRPEKLDILLLNLDELDRDGEATTEYPMWFIRLLISKRLKKRVENDNITGVLCWQLDEKKITTGMYFVHNLETKETNLCSETSLYSHYEIIPPMAVAQERTGK